jgi:uncharacterized SAM-binding protein YcdF (DUF218 family)
MLTRFNLLVGSLTAPSNVLCLMLALGCVLLVVRCRRSGLALVLASTTALLAIGLLPISSLLIMPLEDRFPSPVLPDHVDGIVVLGGSVSPTVSQARGRPAVKGASERLFTAIALARRYPEARLILSGGIVVPRPGAIPEAWIMRDLLSAAGVASERLEVETMSRNTYENALYAYKLAHPAPNETWILVTSGNHMPRAVGCFRKAGFAVLPYPVDYVTVGKLRFSDNFQLSRELRRLDLAVHEWIGLVGYRLLGWTDELFPGPEQANAATPTALMSRDSRR